MKKLVVRLLIVVLLVVVLAVVAVGLLLDKAIKRGVETVGPMVTKTEVKLDSVSLSLLTGSGKIKGLVVGNPEGYKTPSAINLGSASLSLQPGSVLADKVIVKSINVQGPEVTFETDLKGNNLSKLLANVQASTGGTDKEPSREPAGSKPAKKLQVDDFLITGGKIHVSLTALAGQKATVPLPEIHLTNLGQGSDGITAAELTKVVISAIEKEAVKAAAGAVTDLSKTAGDLNKSLDKVTGGSADKITKGVGDLLKKK